MYNKNVIAGHTNLWYNQGVNNYKTTLIYNKCSSDNIRYYGGAL